MYMEYTANDCFVQLWSFLYSGVLEPQSGWSGPDLIDLHLCGCNKITSDINTLYMSKFRAKSVK